MSKQVDLGSPSEFPENFRKVVARELATLGFKVKKWHGHGLDAENAAGKSNYVGMGNLFRRVQTNKPANTLEIVRDFLQHVVKAMNDAPAPQIPDSLEEAASRLIIRIGKEFAKGVPAPWSEKIPDTDDLVMNLVIDFPHTMAYVSSEKMKKSSKSAEQWVQVAINNLKACTPKDWLQTLKGDEGIRCCHTNDSYDAARSLILAEHPETSPHGWLMVVPSRDWLFALPAEIPNLAHFHLLKVIAEKNCAREPYPITDAVYWIRAGHPWIEFPIEIDDDEVRVIPPPEFVEALDMVNHVEENGDES